MNDIYIFFWGVVVFVLTVGPLLVATYLDFRDRRYAKAMEDAAGLGHERSQRPVDRTDPNA